MVQKSHKVSLALIENFTNGELFSKKLINGLEEVLGVHIF